MARWVDRWDEDIALAWYSGERVECPVARRRRLRPPVPIGRPIWPHVQEERPWSMGRRFWEFATPWAWARIYGHVGERVLWHLWWWSRGPVWFATDLAQSVDWWVQGRAKEMHERYHRSERP